jgi:hypothetical protein
MILALDPMLILERQADQRLMKVRDQLEVEQVLSASDRSLDQLGLQQRPG